MLPSEINHKDKSIFSYFWYSLVSSNIDSYLKHLYVACINDMSSSTQAGTTQTHLVTTQTHLVTVSNRKHIQI